MCTFTQDLQLVPGSSTLDDWVKPDVSQYETYYIFHTQNSDGFTAGEVPVVEEVGPFVYRYVITQSLSAIV